ncbi:MAG: PQQ-dependent sugar dehydrogenase [Akkermansiaceae bacterium]|nr:PQQ-dependent sugar dehydrogenase [Akkermansiaceae bacterium]
MKFPHLLITALLALTLQSPGEVRLEKIADGFERPVWAGMPAETEGKLWVMEQAGTIHIMDLATGKRIGKPFLKIEERVTRRGNEQGLLGLAFAPDFKESGRYYVYYNDKKDRTVVSRFTSTNGKTTDPDSEEILLRYDQPYRNHNGGWIDFGPDGMLYIGSGDGGAANDPKKLGQDLDSLLGKLLRIDVSPKTGYSIPKDNPFLTQDGARPEIWAYGLRNPWRCSFDRKTGDLWIGDVGQNQWEEINWMPAGKGAGSNYGWRLREGKIATPKVGGERPKANVDPVYVYAHGSGSTEGRSVTGGYVYRGPIEELQGRYVFADYQLPRIWSLRLVDGKAEDFIDHSKDWKPESGGYQLISSFAEDNEGNLYVISLSGDLYKVSQG